MTPDLIKWAIGSAASFTVVLVAAIVFLLRVSFKLGQTANEIKTVAKDMSAVKALADEVPALKITIETIKETIGQYRSDFKELRRRVDGRSQPDFDSEE